MPFQEIPPCKSSEATQCELETLFTQFFSFRMFTEWVDSIDSYFLSGKTLWLGPSSKGQILDRRTNKFR